MHVDYEIVHVHLDVDVFSLCVKVYECFVLIEVFTTTRSYVIKRR